jgi:hypothetical protein
MNSVRATRPPRIRRWSRGDTTRSSSPAGAKARVLCPPCAKCSPAARHDQQGRPRLRTPPTGRHLCCNRRNDHNYDASTRCAAGQLTDIQRTPEVQITMRQLSRVTFRDCARSKRQGSSTDGYEISKHEFAGSFSEAGGRRPPRINKSGRSCRSPARALRQGNGLLCRARPSCHLAKC